MWGVRSTVGFGIRTRPTVRSPPGKRKGKSMARKTGRERAGKREGEGHKCRRRLLQRQHAPQLGSALALPCPAMPTPRHATARFCQCFLLRPKASKGRGDDSPASGVAEGGLIKKEAFLKLMRGKKTHTNTPSYFFDAVSYEKHSTRLGY